jgi:hypothetical protein
VGTFLNVGFYDQHLAAGPDGSMHLTFMDGAAERVYYGHCERGCNDPAAWSPVLLRTATQLHLLSLGAYGLGVDATGRAHLLLSGVTYPAESANALVYATCASGCGTATGWTFLDLSSLSTGQDAVGTYRPFMVEPSGRVSFLSSDPGIYFACASNCTNLASWSAPVSLNGNPLHAAVDGAGVTHVLLRQGSSAGGTPLFHYARCPSNCTTPASWQVSSLGFLVAGNEWAASLAVTTAGRAFIAYNQGVVSGASDNQRLFLNSCQGSQCLDLNAWSSVTLGTLDEGKDGAWLEASGESVLLASVDAFELKLRECDSSCEAAASWSAPVVADSAAAIAQAWPPDTGSACAGTSESASWWPRMPSAGISSRGGVVVHHPSALVKCPGDPSPDQLPSIGRVISTF